MNITLQGHRLTSRGIWQLLASEHWAHEAACADADPDVFAVPLAAPAVMQRSIAAAKAICATCPVKDTCLQDALDNGDAGVWGGTTEQERRRMQKAAA